MYLGIQRLCMLAYLQQQPAGGIEAACVGDGRSILTASLWIRASLRRASRHGVAERKERQLRIGEGSSGKCLYRRYEGRHGV